MDGGRFIFMKIIFQSHDELCYFKQLVSGYNILTNKPIRNHSGFVITVSSIAPPLLVQCFIKIYVIFRLRQKLEEIIRTVYFYSNKSEVERIIEWAHYLLYEKSFVKEQLNNRSLYDYLYVNLLEQYEKLHNVREIYFDTVILFQFQQFHKRLIDIVGYAIDEIKREEEYQNYLQNMRNYVHARKVKRSLIHVVQREPFQFFNEYGSEIVTKDLILAMHDTPLYLFGLDETELNIAPTLALLPERLYIYGVNANEGKTLSLLTIFEERATFLPIHKFPF